MADWKLTGALSDSFSVAFERGSKLLRGKSGLILFFLFFFLAAIYMHLNPNQLRSGPLCHFQRDRVNICGRAVGVKTA